MNLQPVEHSSTFNLRCIRCERSTPAIDAMVDLDATEPDAYYCPRCAALIQIAKELGL